MADQQNQELDPVSESWDRNIKLRNDLASRAGKPDNLEIKPLDAPKQLMGSAVSSVGTGIKELSLGDVARAGETVQKGSMLSKGVNWLAGKAADTFLSPEDAAQAKMAAAAATGLADGANVNGSSNDTNKAINTVADAADVVIEPVAKAVGGTIKGGGDWVKDSVSEQGKEAMNRQFFTEDKSGSLHAGDAWTADPAVWAMKMSDVIGTIGGTLVVGGAVKGGVKAAVTRSMLKRGAPEAYAAQVAELTAQRIGEKAAFSTGAAMSVGQTADQTRESVKSLSFEELMNSDSFKQNVQLVNQDPQYQSLSSSDRLDLARQRTADMAADYAKSDPTTYAAAAAGTVLGDAMLFKMITGKAGAAKVTGNLLSRAGKGFAIGGLGEGVGEAVEEGAQQNIQNRSDNAVAGTNIDPMQGVKQSAAEAGLLGVMSGGGIGAGSSAVHGSNNPAQTSDGAEQTGDFSPDLQSAAESSPEDAVNNSQPSDDLLNTPAYQRQGNISPELQAATQQVNAEQQQFKQALAAEENGVLAPIEKTVTGNPDEPAFLRTQQNNPTGRDPSELQDANPYTDVQQALSQGATKTPEQLISEAKLSQGKTASESELTGNVLLADSQPSAPIPINNDGVTIDGQANEVIPESRGIGYTGTINMPGTGGDGVNSNYIPPVTANRISADQSLGIESTRDPRSPVAQSIDSAGNQANDIFSQLQTLRVTKRGNPFASQKEALLASRKTETPIELPTGGFGVVDKAELELVQKQAELNKWNQARIEAGLAPFTNERPSEEDADLEVWGKALNEWANEEANQSINDISAIDGKNNQQNKDGIAVDQNEREDGKTELLSNGLRLFHGSSNADLTLDDIQIVRSNQKQGKKGRSYGGFYGSVEDDISNAERYANMSGNPGTMYEANIAPGTKVLHKVGDVTRLSERYIDELRSQGYGLVVGRDPTGRHTEYAVIDKSAISGFGKKGEVKSQSTATITNDGAKSKNIPDSILSAFPDMQVSNEGYLGLNPFTLSEREALKNAGLVQEVKSADGSSYLAVDPEKLWDLRKTRSEELKNTKTEISQEERNRAIENRASSYDRLANEQDELGDLGDKELAAKYRAKAEEVRQRKSTSQPIADQAVGTSSPETVTAPVVTTDSQPKADIAPINGDTAEQIVEHTTGKGKVLRGVVRTGLTVAQAKAIDPYTFKKDGGHFIREQHLDKLSGVKAETSITAEPEAENDATFTPRDGWETNLQAAREYANHLRKAGKISEQDALKAWNSTESLAKLIKQIEVVQTPVVGHGDDAITLDQLKQLRVDIINKINQQEADNRSVDDRLMRKKGQLDKAIDESEQAAKKEQRPNFADMPEINNAETESLAQELGLMVADGKTMEATKKLKSWQAERDPKGKMANWEQQAIIDRAKTIADNIKSQPKRGGDPQPDPEPTKDRFADNKLFTADRVAAARARMKSKMGNLNSGLDPEMLVDGMTIAGAYIESGVRDFTAYAKSMTDDFGDGIKPFLLSFWEGARNYPGLDTKGMTSVEDSAKQHAELASNKPAQTEKADTPPTEQPANRERQILRDGLHEKLGAGESINNNNDLKRVAAELLGVKTGDLSTMQLKEAQEAYEAAAVRHRRDAIVDVLGRGDSVPEAFRSAVEAYEGQPNLDVRTAKSSDLQAYSTPTPMALLANLAAGAWAGKTVFEPTAGNGLLLLTADAKTTYSNELDPDRADSLAWSGFNVTIKDATNNPLEGMVPEKVDSVLANPPFGKYRDEAGKPAKVEFSDPQGRTHVLGEIDHIIAKNALDAMKDDGKATLILGAPKEAGDYTGNNKAFLNWLYSNYNVVHHVEAGGDLFKGQGAGWPTQMIVIHGRAKDGTGKFAPFKGEIQRLNTWDSIYDSFKQQGLLDTQGAVFSKTTGHGQLSEGYQPVAELSGSERSDNQQTGRNGGRDGAGRSGRSGKSAGNGVRQQSGNSTSPDRAFDSQPDLSGRKLEPTESKPATNSGNSDGDQRADNLGLSGERNGNAVDKPQKKEISTVVKKANEYQAEYQTASNGLNKDVLTPVNMASYTQSALASIQDRHGSVDQFVANRLGYDSTTDMNKVLMGLQADAVALAVDAIERGRAIIIGDQTGVGKGRQAAGVIRYAMQKGKIPIFITQKPNLFTDMYDDLADIGVEGVKPLIVNQDNGFISKGDKTLFNLSPKERTAALNHVIKTGKLPDGHNALFLTYSQISSDSSGKKFALLDTIAENAIMVMDESHTASGQDSKLGLAFQSLVNKVNGLVYLSATYAKRPDNMLLYTRTDLGQAVDNREALVSIIANGGLGMQTYIAGKLAEAGQMVRRERSFEGIEIKNHTIKDKTNKIKTGFDQATSALRAIQDLSEAWRGYVESVLAKQIQKESGMDTRIAGNQADTKVDVTLFSSVVHNYIAQLSLGLKAKETAKLAIEAINRNERPVIALENTMGAALKDYMQRTGKRVGDSASDLTYSTLLKSIADGALAYTVKTPGQKDNEKKVYMPISKISDPLIQSLYNQVMDAADAMTIDIPASPIDAIRYEIIKAGYTVAEITGRDMVLDYANNHEIANRPAREKNRRRVVDAFNSKKLDVLILNQAGSTGLSIHASERFADQSPRHMIVAQPSLDINTFLQMLGRVNRTGQVELPSYSLAWLDLPSEKRPAAVLSRKMSSLNANTSGNTDSATSIEAVDILNPYGDQVVEAFVEANRETLMQYSPRLVRLPMDDQATYFLGKLAVLPSDVAENVINQIEKEYNALIEYLNATGQNELNINEVDLDATPVKQRIVSEGRKGAGVFSEPTYVTKADVKAQGKAPTWDEVNAALKDSSQADFDEAVSRMMTDNGFADRLKERLAKAEKNLEINRQAGKSTKAETEQVQAIKLQISSHEAEKNNLAHLFSSRGMYRHGGVLRIRLPDSEEAITGIVAGLTFDNDGGNPAAKSKWRMKIMVADRVRSLPISLSQAEGGVVEGQRIDNDYNLKAIFDLAASQPGREYRYIMTGNLIEAQNCSVEKGRIIPFTTSDGRVIQGMLMPKKFDPEAGSLREDIKVTSAQAFQWLSDTNDRTSASLGLRTREGDVVLRRLFNGGYEIEMPKAVSKGKRYWGDPAMVKLIGEHAVKGNGKLNVRLTNEQAKGVVSVMERINPLTITNQAQIADFNRMTGKSVPAFSDKGMKFSKVKMTAAEQAGKGMTKPEATLAAKEWLKQFKTDINVRVVKDQAEFKKALADLGQPDALQEGEVANAAYLPESNTILINAAAVQNPTRLRQILRHEVLAHYGLEKVVGREAYQKVMRALQQGAGTSPAIQAAFDKVTENYQGADVDELLREVFAHYAENRPVDGGAVSRLWQRVVNLVKAALQKVGFIRQSEAETALDDVLNAIAENMRNGVTNVDPETTSKVQFSKQGKTADTSSYGKVSDALSLTGSRLINWVKEQRGWGLGTLTDLQIDQIYRDITGGAVNRYQKLRAKMEADRNDILLDAETNIDPLWDAMPKAEKAALSNLMHDATMSKLHPDMALEDNTLYQEVKEKLAKARTPETKAAYQAELDTIKENHKNLSERYRLSSKQTKELYQKMRDVYTKQWADLRDAIEQRIEDQMGDGGKALASEMRLKMEQALKHGPYFPLARFGKYVIRGRKGDQYFREHFEKRKDAEAALKQYRSEGFKATLSVKEEGSGDQANAHALGMEIMEALDKAQKEGTNPADLKDAVWQAMLEMLPDASFAKHAIHRKRVKGASRDGHRAYLQSVYHYAHHVSKIRYGHKMKAELDAMKDQVKLAERGEESAIKPDDIEVAQQVLNEMNKRHELNMNPKGSSLAGMAGNIGFLFYLGVSPASAVINLTQNVMVMLPQLAGKYGLMKASKFMMKAMSDYIRHGVFKAGTKEAWVSLTRATKGVSNDEKEMLNTLYRAGVLDLTQAHSIAARADTDQQNVKQSAAWARAGMRWAGSLFHNAEVLNREVAALTAYRLLKEQNPKISMDSAVDQVTEMVYDGHGNYAASNRPRYMRGDVMKVLTQFKIYSQMMTYTLARNAILAAKGDKAALRTVGAMMGTTWLMSGAMGLPTPVSLLLYGIAAAFDDDDDRSAEASFRLGLTDALGPELGELIAKGPMDDITGLNISGRTGLGDLWWRSPKEGTEGDDLTFHYMQQVAGPVLGIGISGVRGLRDFANGDIQRGVEAVSPKVVKDLAKAYRQASEGEQTRNGDSVIDDVGAWNVAMQAMGFSSAKMSQVYAARGYIKGKEKVIEDERSNLLADFFDAKRSGDEEAMRDVMERIKAFNSKHDRAETITGRTLMQSIKSRNRSMERTQAGVYLSKKREYLRSEGKFLEQ